MNISPETVGAAVAELYKAHLYTGKANPVLQGTFKQEIEGIKNWLRAKLWPKLTPCSYSTCLPIARK